jgi:transcriptional regulator with XRE-family HTH domain
MNELNQEIGQRLQGLRELSGAGAADFARAAGIDEETLAAYEAGERDIPVSVLHNVAQAYGVSITELMTGEAARLRQYCLVRKGKGVAVERREAYGYRSMGYNFEGRQMDPYLITIPPGDDDFHLNTHSGQEFHYCLEGSFIIQIGDHRITLGEGDSIYFDSAYPHGMKALGGKPVKSLVIITM